MIGRDAPRPRNLPANRGRRIRRLRRLVRRKIRWVRKKRGDRRQRELRVDVGRSAIQTCREEAAPKRTRKAERSRTECWRRSEKGKEIGSSGPPRLAIGRPTERQTLDLCTRKEGVRSVPSRQLRQITQQGEDGSEVLEGLAPPGAPLGLQGLPRRASPVEAPLRRRLGNASVALPSRVSMSQTAAGVATVCQPRMRLGRVALAERWPRG